MEEGVRTIDVNGKKYQVLEQLAYQGKEDCVSVECRRYIKADGTWGACLGYHCPKCDLPCGERGHKC